MLIAGIILHTVIHSPLALATVRDKLARGRAVEIMRLNPDDLLLLRQIRYYAEREFAGLYDPA